MTSRCVEVTPGFVLELGRSSAPVGAALQSFLIGSRPIAARSGRAIPVIRVDDPPEIPAGFTPVAAREGLAVIASGERIVFAAPSCRARIGAERVELWLGHESAEALHELVTLLMPPLLLELAWSRGAIGIHAASLSIDGRGVLLPGPSGCGKSTIFTNAARCGLDVLSDDLSWIHTSPDSWRIRPFVRGAPFAPTASPTVAEASLQVLVFPEIVAAARSRIVPLSRAECLPRLLRQVSTLARDEGGSRFQQMATLADRVPAFALLAGRDRERVPALLRTLVGNVDRRRPTATV